MECLDIAPAVEGRIKIANEEDISKLNNEHKLHEYVQERLAPKARFPAEKMAQIEANFKLFDYNGDGTKKKTLTGSGEKLIKTSLKALI